MGRVWVLDTETKGTGAEMVPLDKVQKKPAPSQEPFWAPPKRRPREPKPAEPRAPLKFKVVDVLSRAVLAEDAMSPSSISSTGDERGRASFV